MRERRRVTLQELAGPPIGKGAGDTTGRERFENRTSV